MVVNKVIFFSDTIASRFRGAYFFIMAQTTNKDSSNNFYALVKELLETQTATLKKVTELSDKVDKLSAQNGGKKDKDLAKLWEGI